METIETVERDGGNSKEILKSVRDSGEGSRDSRETVETVSRQYRQ